MHYFKWSFLELEVDSSFLQSETEYLARFARKNAKNKLLSASCLIGTVKINPQTIVLDMINLSKYIDGEIQNQAE